MTVVEQQRPLDSRRQDAPVAEIRRCETPMCGQAIASIRGNGESIFPLVPKVYAEDGSMMIVCPVCQRRHRFTIRRRVA